MSEENQVEPKKEENQVEPKKEENVEVTLFGFFEDFHRPDDPTERVDTPILRAITEGVKELTQDQVNRIEAIEKTLKALPDLARINSDVTALVSSTDEFRRGTKAANDKVDLLASKIERLKYVTKEGGKNVIHIQDTEPSTKQLNALWHETSKNLDNARFTQPWEWDELNQLWLSQINILSLHQHQMTGTSEYNNLSLYFAQPLHNRKNPDARDKQAKITFVQVSFFFKIDEMSKAGLADANSIKIKLSRVDSNNKKRDVLLKESTKEYSDKKPGEMFSYNYTAPIEDDFWLLGRERHFGVCIDHGFSKISLARVTVSIGVKYVRIDLASQLPTRCISSEVTQDNFDYLFS